MQMWCELYTELNVSSQPPPAARSSSFSSTDLKHLELHSFPLSFLWTGGIQMTSGQTPLPPCTFSGSDVTPSDLYTAVPLEVKGGSEPCRACPL